MINLKDGALWQWDIGKQVIVTPMEGNTIDRVEFANDLVDSAIPGEITGIDKNGNTLATVPAVLLQFNRNITVYAMSIDGLGARTIDSVTFVVNKRVKPEDYIFTDDEIRTYQKYEERLKYLEENIVVPEKVDKAVEEEVAKQLPEWSKKSAPDKTLTLDGQAADAKVTGDNLRTLTQAIANESAERQWEIARERTRINNLTKMEEGSTTGDAELQDVRVGSNGEVYETAGEAVRGQIGNVHNLLGREVLNSKNICDIDDGEYTSKTDVLKIMAENNNLTLIGGSIFDAVPSSNTSVSLSTFKVPTDGGYTMSVVADNDYLTSDGAAGFNVVLYKVSDSTVVNMVSLSQSLAYPKKVTLSSDEEYYIQIKTTSASKAYEVATSFETVSFKVQIEKGDVATEWQNPRDVEVTFKVIKDVKELNENVSKNSDIIQGHTEDIVRLTEQAQHSEEKLDSLTLEVMQAILNNPKPILFGKVTPKANVIYSLVADGDFTYATIWRELYKIDWTKEHTPTYISMNCTPTGANATDVELDETGGYSKYYNGGAGWLVRSIAITDNYLYAAMRYSGGVKVDEQLYYGGLAIIRKSDFTVVKTLWTKTINTRVVVHGNILALGNQMHGLQFYDITEPENLILKSEILYNYIDSEGNTIKSSTESQAGEFVEINGSLYYVNIGFAEGFVVYNVDDVENPTEVTKWKFKDALEWTSVHTYDKVISYPYMYITVAYNGADKLVEEHADRTGVITLDITDITNPTVLNVCTINESDVCAFNNVGDTKPTEIKRFNNTLVVNYEDGILEFLISEDGKSCTYLGKFKPTSNYGAYALCTLEDGRFFAGGMNADSVGTVYLYRGL